MTKKKIFIAIAVAAIPAAFVAAAVKAANRLTGNEELEDDDATCGESIADDGEKETPHIDNEVKWWTGQHFTNDRKLHIVGCYIYDSN